MIAALRILEVSGVLDGVGVRRRTERARLRVRVAERRRYLFLTFLGRKGNVLRPESRRHPVLEDEMWAHVCNESTVHVHRRYSTADGIRRKNVSPVLMRRSEN